MNTKPKKPRIEDDPESFLNRKHLVTENYGARLHVLYHGNNENQVATLMARGKIPKNLQSPGGKRRPGVVRTVRKHWILVESVREEK